VKLFVPHVKPSLQLKMHLGNTRMQSMKQEHFPANIAEKDINGDPVYPNISRNVDKLHSRQIQTISLLLFIF